MRLNQTSLFVLALAGIGVVSLIRGQPLDALISVVAAGGVMANDASRRPGAALAKFGRYLFLGLLAFLAVVRISMPG